MAPHVDHSPSQSLQRSMRCVTRWKSLRSTPLATNLGAQFSMATRTRSSVATHSSYCQSVACRCDRGSRQWPVQWLWAMSNRSFSVNERLPETVASRCGDVNTPPELFTLVRDPLSQASLTQCCGRNNQAQRSHE